MKKLKRNSKNNLRYRVDIWNDGEMPPNLDTTDKLFMKHSPKPYNPKLANVLFKSGMLEVWRRGFEKIKGLQKYIRGYERG